MLYCAGIDVGSSATKAVILDAEGQSLGLGLCHSGADFTNAAKTAFEQALREAKIETSAITRIIATGYGRSNVAFAHDRRTEIDTHARGAYHHFPRAITIVDIGGQDNKVIRLDENGRRVSFSMNRKCAAGTGSFLEEMAGRLKIPLEQFSKLAEQSRDESVRIGSYCTVFAMTEILSKIRGGAKAEDLARAALDSVARRILEAESFSGDVVATGGVVAHNPLMKDILSRTLKTAVFVPPHPQHIGAFGAALAALKSS